MGRLTRWLDGLPMVRGAIARRGLLASIGRSPNFRFLAWAEPGHFHSPIPDADEIGRRAPRIFDVSARSLPAIEIDDAAMQRFALDCAEAYAALPFPARADGRTRYHLDNGYFSYGDGVMLWSFLRRFRPRRVVEVGSGWSSAAMLDADEACLGGATEFTFIEPHPERLRRLLRPGDAARCRILEAPVQDVPDDVFLALGEDDILFIDSSHVAKAGSDVVHLVSNVLPRLAKGVIVHVHDVLWPFEYPRSWIDEGRAWNEAYVVRAFLEFNSAFRIVYFNSYMAVHHEELLARTLPLAVAKPSDPAAPGNTSLWLRRVA